MLLRKDEVQIELLHLIVELSAAFYVNGQKITDLFTIPLGIPVVARADFERPPSIYMDALVNSDLLILPEQDVSILLDQRSELLRLYDGLLVIPFPWN